MGANRKKLNVIFKKYKLNREEHTFQSDDFTIIKRIGIKMIQQAEAIQLTYDLVHQNGTTVTVLVKGYFEGIQYQTYGEANPQNNTFSFPVSIAQKRGESRIILEMVGLYDCMGEDEIGHQPKSAHKMLTDTEKGANAAASVVELMSTKVKST